MQVESNATTVDAFILFNEREERVAGIVGQLSSRGIATYFWRRDIKPGEPWQEVEYEQLSGARTVLVFLGAQGWGPTHLKLTHEAMERGKRVIPVLVGDPPSDAFKEANGLFIDRRYVDLRVPDEAAYRLLVDGIRSEWGPSQSGQLEQPLSEPRSGRFDDLIRRLIDGDEVGRQSVLDAIVDGLVTDKAGLAARLREELERRFSPESEARFATAVRDLNQYPSIRSWMLSALIWADVENPLSRALTSKHLNATFEGERAVRFWTLAGLYQCRASYLEEAAGLCLSDPSPDVALLAEAIVARADHAPPRSDIVHLFQKMMAADDFANSVWPALRVLRVVPIPPLAPELCDLIAREPPSSPLAYDSLYALSIPPTAATAAPILDKMYGPEKLLNIVIDVIRNSVPGAPRQFAHLLLAVDGPPLQRALAAAAEQDGGTANTLRRHMQELRNRRVTGPQAFVAGYASDEIDVKRDDLGIREDVQTLTAVMLAREVIPPLAIGLFGDWGAGKSFFMRSIKQAAQNIAADAQRRSSDRFCTEVVSIEFNAWHYADTNLWASLVSHILERLAEHVSPAETPEQQQAKLVQQLDSAKQVISQIESEKKSAEQQIAEKQSELQKLQLEREQKELQLRDLRLTDLRSIFENDPDLQKQLKQALQDIGVPAMLSNLADLGRAVSEVNSLRGRTAGLAMGLFKAQNLPIALGCLALALLLPIGVGYLLREWLDSHFVLLSTIVAEIATFLGGAAALLSKAATHVRTNLEKIEAAKQKVDQALAERRNMPSAGEQQLQNEIAKLKADEEQVSSRLQAATCKVIELEQRIAALIESRSLARFLAERTKSDDYRKHLGVISTIRQDFEALAKQLTEPVSGSALRKVERIILYIDDLDRCPANKVVEVLEAVHLLLAYPLFVVVVGVDPRWLSYSLTSIYPVLEEAGSGTDPKSVRPNARAWRPTPQNYLEKIFQIPFSLRPMTRTGYARLVEGLFSPGEPGAKRERATGQTSTSLQQRPLPTQPELPAAGQNKAGANPAPASPIDPGQDNRSAAAEFVIHDDAMQIKPVEQAFAKRLFELLPTPRATKRFSNTYRLLKAPIPSAQLRLFEGTEELPGTFQVPMLLLAILIGAPADAATFFPRLYEYVKRPDVSTDLEVSAILDLVPSELDDVIRGIVVGERFPRSAALFEHWLRRVSRFSFEIGRTIKSRAAEE